MNEMNILARKLRKNQTQQEAKLWHFLRNNQVFGLKFRRQYPIGNYIVDFICKECKLIIEVDGGQHNNSKEILKDAERTKFLNTKGYKVLRFWNFEIDNNIDGVYDAILENICINKNTPHPNPLPRRGK